MYTLKQINSLFLGGDKPADSRLPATFPVWATPPNRWYQATRPVVWQHCRLRAGYYTQAAAAASGLIVNLPDGAHGAEQRMHNLRCCGTRVVGRPLNGRSKIVWILNPFFPKQNLIVHLLVSRDTMRWSLNKSSLPEICLGEAPRTRIAEFWLLTAFHMIWHRKSLLKMELKSGPLRSLIPHQDED